MVRLDDPALPPLVLTGPAAAIWHALEEHPTLDALVAALGEEYDVPLDQLRSDVATFLDELVEQRLVVPAAAAG